jgi:hypothetical protein
MKKRADSQDFRVCAAHDLAPIFEKAFGIHPKQLGKNSKFPALVKEYGLELPAEEHWSGLGDMRRHIRTSVERKKKGRRAELFR